MQSFSFDKEKQSACTLPANFVQRKFGTSNGPSKKNINGIHTCSTSFKVNSMVGWSLSLTEYATTLFSLDKSVGIDNKSVMHMVKKSELIQSTDQQTPTCTPARQSSHSNNTKNSTSLLLWKVRKCLITQKLLKICVFIKWLSHKTNPVRNSSVWVGKQVSVCVISFWQ